jgi:hypothetical protein
MSLKSIKKHLPHYLSLVGILIAGVIGFWAFSYDVVFQIAVAVAVAISYVLWGVVHHHIHDDLHAIVVVEYIAVASLGLFVAISLILRT